MTSSTSSSRAARAAALLGPALILFIAFLFFNRPETQVVSKAARAMDERFAKAPMDVVITGNSVANRAVDLTQLASVLGTRPDSCHSAHVDASRPPTWYAVLENRIFEKGYRPRLIVVISKLEHMAETRFDGTSSLLTDFMQADDTVIQEKTYGTQIGSRTWYLMKRRRDELKEFLLAGSRNLTVGTLFTRGPGSLTERGERIAIPALEKVFGKEGAVDLTLMMRAVPVAEDSRAREAKGISLADPRDSYIPELVRLARDNGAKIVFVRVPMAPTFNMDPFPAQAEREIIEFFNELGAGWIDLSRLELGSSSFADQAHLNADGRRVFTQALGERLKQMNALEEGPMPRSLAPLVPTALKRVGVPPGIPPLARLAAKKDSTCAWRASIQVPQGISDPELAGTGAGFASPIVLLEDGVPLTPHVDYARFASSCAGAFKHIPDTLQFSPLAADMSTVPNHAYEARYSTDFPMKTEEGQTVWWVYPGTSAQIEFDQVWEAGAFVVSVSALAFGNSGGMPFLQVSGSETVRMSGSGNLFRGEYRGPAPHQPVWSVQVTSPVDGPFLLLRGLTIGEGERASTVLGRSTSEKGVSLLMVGLRKPPVEYTWESAPPRLPGEKAVLYKGMIKIPLKGMEFLLGANIKKVTESKGCNPIELLQNGSPSTLAYTSCSKLMAVETPGWCMGRGGMHIRPDQISELQTSENEWSIRLLENRECADVRFLYPGDRMHIRVRKEVFSVGADLLRVLGHIIEEGEKDAEIHLKLTVRDVTILEESRKMSALKEGLDFDLGGRIPPDETQIELLVTSPADAPYFIMSSIALVESRPFESLGMVAQKAP